MQAIHQHCLDGTIPATVAAVISNNPDSGALEYAVEHGLGSAAVNHKEFATRLAFENALAACINDYQPDLVALAGFMRVLSADFTNRYSGRLINIHPSLLPRHKGLNTHERVLMCGERWHGCSVHFVSPALDGGPLVARSVVPVLPDDNAERLANRVLQKEHVLYPRIIADFIQGDITCCDDIVLWQGTPLRYPPTI